jgi:hypothetical protein
MFRVSVLDHWKEKHKSRANEHVRIRRELEALETERQRIFAMHRSGVYTDKEFLEQKNMIEVQKNEKGRRLNRGADNGEWLDQALTDLAELFESPGRSWVELEPTYSRRLEFQRMVFSETLPFDGQTFGTARLTCAYGMMREFQGDRSGLVAQIRARWNHVVEELCRWTMEERS